MRLDFMGLLGHVMLGKIINGAVPGGSGEVWHYKIKWVGPELEGSPCWVEGGYPIWGQFEVIMDHGTMGGEHMWFTMESHRGMEQRRKSKQFDIKKTK
jgi:hypothetical protein